MRVQCQLFPRVVSAPSAKVNPPVGASQSIPPPRSAVHVKSPTVIRWLGSNIFSVAPLSDSPIMFVGPSGGLIHTSFGGPLNSPLVTSGVPEGKTTLHAAPPGKIEHSRYTGDLVLR